MDLVIHFTPTGTPKEYRIQVEKDPELDWWTVHQTLATLIHSIGVNHLQARPVEPAPLVQIPVGNPFLNGGRRG
jgi:hypothetical protein